MRVLTSASHFHTNITFLGFNTEVGEIAIVGSLAVDLTLLAETKIVTIDSIRGINIYAEFNTAVFCFV